MNETELRRLLAAGETAVIEYKSDRGPLPDHDLVEMVVCLANYRGGTLLLGVEDDGRVTGLHPNHQTTPEAIAALIAARTVPPHATEVQFVDLPEGKVAVIEVPVARQPIATASGKTLIRFEDPGRQPGCRPLYPYELINWRAERGLADFSALPVYGAAWSDLDALEFARLRRIIEENRGDIALLELADDEIARAMGLVVELDGRPTPTVAGLLLLGKEAALQQQLPAHEVAFQVLRGLDVAVNEFRRWPLLRIHEWLIEAINVRNEEQELMTGAVRVGIPRYDPRVLREAIHNALIHRDYTRLGAIHVQLHDDFVLVSSPGGFVAGVHPGNLLIAAPRPRNPLLADAFKRVGLVERTGRGVNLIYLGQLQNGRRPPDYSHSTETSVTVSLDSGLADLAFVQLALQANRRLERALRLPELAALWLAWKEEPASIPALAEMIQQQPGETLERLAEAGFVQSDTGVYRLNPGLREPGLESEATTLTPEEAILAYVAEHGRITRREAAEVGKISPFQATRVLQKLVAEDKLISHGKWKSAYYTLPT